MMRWFPCNFTSANRRAHPARHAPLATRHCSPAFTLVELLIALAIGVVLLMATAFALDAIVRSSTVNIDSADGLQKARLAMTRVLDEIRTGHDHLPDTSARVSTFQAGTGTTDSGITFTAGDGQPLRYRYDAGAKTLSMTRGTGSAVVLARRVDAFTVQMIPSRSDSAQRVGGPYDLLTRATITLTLRPATNAPPTTLSASVAPRQQKWE
jgi:prepilin-type N-terminal cleavage/methylation domain-containing protein